MTLIETITWMRQGKCRDYPTEMFYPTQGADYVTAERICWQCPVREECLEYALDNNITYGIWGGESERSRRRLRRIRTAQRREEGLGPLVIRHSPYRK
jgi:WhiB family redox-sensing transcriptional regulator